MHIQYYEKECNCSDFKPVLENVLQTLNLQADQIETFKSIKKAQQAGVPELPALIIDQKLVFSGYLPSLKQLTKMLKKYAN